MGGRVGEGTTIEIGCQRIYIDFPGSHLATKFLGNCLSTRQPVKGTHRMETYAPQLIIAAWFATGALLTYSVAAWSHRS